MSTLRMAIFLFLKGHIQDEITLAQSLQVDIQMLIENNKDVFLRFTKGNIFSSPT